MQKKAKKSVLRPLRKASARNFYLGESARPTGRAGPSCCAAQGWAADGSYPDGGAREPREGIGDWGLEIGDWRLGIVRDGGRAAGAAARDSGIPMYIGTERVGARPLTVSAVAEPVKGEQDSRTSGFAKRWVRFATGGRRRRTRTSDSLNGFGGFAG